MNPSTGAGRFSSIAASQPAANAGATAFNIVHGKTIFFCVALVLFGGLMSGLQQAMARISQAEVTSMGTDGNEAEKIVARRLVPFVNRRHLTLITLVLGNAFAMEALPIFMHTLMSKAAAIILSVTFVVLFGEVIPQAVCLKWPVPLASSFSWLVNLLLIVLYPCTAPIAALLDWILGNHEDPILSRRALRQFAIMHGETSRGGPLNEDELNVILGALDLHKRTAGDTGITLDRVFMLSDQTKLTYSILGKIAKDGFSRVPIYKGRDRTNIVGLLLVKQLIRLDLDFSANIFDVMYPILVVGRDVSLFALLKRFCLGESHMAIVVNSVDTPDGIRVCDHLKPGSDAKHVTRIVTLEDVLETLLRKDIRDETDVFQPTHFLRHEPISPRLTRTRMSSLSSLRTSPRRIESSKLVYDSA